MPVGTAFAAEPWTPMLSPPGRPTEGADADFDAIKGIIAGSGLAVLFFWLPLALAVLRASG